MIVLCCSGSLLSYFWEDRWEGREEARLVRAVEKDKEAGVGRRLQSLAPVLSTGAQGSLLLQGLVSLVSFLSPLLIFE